MINLFNKITLLPLDGLLYLDSHNSTCHMHVHTYWNVINGPIKNRDSYIHNKTKANYLRIYSSNAFGKYYTWANSRQVYCIEGVAKILQKNDQHL